MNGVESLTSGAPAWTVVNNQPVLEFDAAAIETTLLSGVLSSAYAGGGVTVTLIWTSATATSGDCMWASAIERQPVGHPIGTDDFAAGQTVTATAPGTAGTLVYTTIAFTHGAQMDSLAVGERFRMWVSRSATNGSDTMTGDARLVAVSLRET